MTKVKPGDIVRIHSTGTLLGGTRFDSSENRDPLEFQVGSGQVIAGLDAALPDMNLQTQTGEGQVLMFRVVDLGEDDITLDANHALAGLDLTFEIELMSINAT